MAQDNYTRRWKPQRLIDMNFSSIGSNWHKVGYEVATDAAEAGTTTTVINATAHSAVAGDVIIMTNGGEDGEAIEVASVTANTITLISALSGAPSATETFTIIRPVVLNKANLIQLDSTLNDKVLLAESQEIPTIANFSIRANGDKSFDLKSNNLHAGANNAFEATSEYYLWVKIDTAAPTSGELDIVVIE
jgi:hypothetical protein